MRYKRIKDNCLFITVLIEVVMYRYSYKTSPALPKKVMRDCLSAITYLANPTNTKHIEKVIEERNLPSSVLNYLEDAISLYNVSKIRESLEFNTSKDTMESLSHSSWVDSMQRVGSDISELYQYTARSIDKALSDLDGIMPTNFKDWRHPLDLSKTDISELDRYYDYTTYVVPMIREVLEIQNKIKVLPKFVEYTEYLASLALKRNKSEGEGDPEPGIEHTEKMWHVTTARNAIMSGGFKTRQELGDSAGLGGHVEGISFTASYEVAEGIEAALIDAVNLLSSDRTKKTLIAYGEEIGLDRDTIETCLNQNGMKNKEVADLRDAFGFFQYALSMAHSVGLRYDPLFFGVDPEKIAAVPLGNIGIIEATIDTTQPHSYHSAMEEWRVPIRAITSYGVVGSQ
jgi:hypothetical protein